MNVFELAILRTARQYEERQKRRPLNPKERHQAELVLKWATQILDRQEKNNAGNDNRNGTRGGTRQT